MSDGLIWTERRCSRQNNPQRHFMPTGYLTSLASLCLSCIVMHTFLLAKCLHIYIFIVADGRNKRLIWLFRWRTVYLRDAHSLKVQLYTLCHSLFCGRFKSMGRTSSLGLGHYLKNDTFSQMTVRLQTFFGSWILYEVEQMSFVNFCAKSICISSPCAYFTKFLETILKSLHAVSSGCSTKPITKAEVHSGLINPEPFNSLNISLLSAPLRLASL